MSWSYNREVEGNVADIPAGELDTIDGTNPGSKQTASQAWIAARQIIDSGVLGTNKRFLIAMTGHANPRNEPAHGYVNDFMTLTIQQLDGAPQLPLNQRTTTQPDNNPPAPPEPPAETQFPPEQAPVPDANNEGVERVDAPSNDAAMAQNATTAPAEETQPAAPAEMVEAPEVPDPDRGVASDQKPPENEPSV